MNAKTFERFNAKHAAVSDGCWQWAGSLVTQGYGVLRDGQRRQYAHRLSYEHFKGPIPKGLEIDHLCRNRGCVNPDHLEAVTHKVNMLRGEAPRIKLHRAKVCAKGHPLTGDNIIDRSKYKSNGKQMCRICRNARAMALKRKWSQSPEWLEKHQAREAAWMRAKRATNREGENRKQREYRARSDFNAKQRAYRARRRAQELAA